ncbi:hypothetical protein NDU88_009729 [Pleurodeles waltl]|uniref:Uncharacterized protein n=1 Tax=Pleurodeles waltl TaxID=8319 RepID=A0AAV7PVT2_PLEWA|nr:hypothetical protein NDU88_009729 [Pleurodeles waltl]
MPCWRSPSKPRRDSETRLEPALPRSITWETARKELPCSEAAAFCDHLINTAHPERGRARCTLLALGLSGGEEPRLRDTSEPMVRIELDTQLISDTAYFELRALA